MFIPNYTGSCMIPEVRISIECKGMVKTIGLRFYKHLYYLSKGNVLVSILKDLVHLLFTITTFPIFICDIIKAIICQGSIKYHKLV